MKYKAVSCTVETSIARQTRQFRGDSTMVRRREIDRSLTQQDEVYTKQRCDKEKRVRQGE